MNHKVREELFRGAKQNSDQTDLARVKEIFDKHDNCNCQKNNFNPCVPDILEQHSIHSEKDWLEWLEFQQQIYNKVVEAGHKKGWKQDLR